MAEQGGPSQEEPFGEPMVDAGYANYDQLKSPESHPEWVVRNVASKVSTFEGLSRHETQEALAAALFELDEYGIEFPGISNTRHNLPSGMEQAYTVTSRVEGHNMLTEMSRVPMHIVMQTVESILSYYEDKLEADDAAPFLADLSLRQCVYGTVPPETEPHVYFVDLDPVLASVSQSSLLANGLAALGREIDHIEERYPIPIDSYQERIAALKSKHQSLVDAQNP